MSPAQTSATDTKGTEGGKTTNSKVAPSVTLGDARRDGDLLINTVDEDDEPKRSRAAERTECFHYLQLIS